MAFSRYRGAPVLSLGKQYGTYRAIAAVRQAIKNGIVPIVSTITIKEGQRLDHLAGLYYNDSNLWWAIAAASDIGWGLQVPPGTIINIPDINAISSIVG